MEVRVLADFVQSRWEFGVRKVGVAILSKNLSLGKLGFGFHLGKNDSAV